MKKTKEKHQLDYIAPRMGVRTISPRVCIATSSLSGSTDSYGEDSGSWTSKGNETYDESDGKW